MTIVRSIAATTVAIASCVALTLPAFAGSTDPVLIIGQATTSGGEPVRVLDLLGAWGFDDVLQIQYPLNIVVSQGTSFVRYPIGNVAMSGTFGGLADGLGINEISALEATGGPATDAFVVRAALHEMTIALPAIFAPGSVNVVLYTTLPGEGTFLSNSIETVRGEL